MCVLNLQSHGEMVTDTSAHLASCCELIELVLRKGLQRQYRKYINYIVQIHQIHQLHCTWIFIMRTRASIWILFNYKLNNILVHFCTAFEMHVWLPAFFLSRARSQSGTKRLLAVLWTASPPRCLRQVTASCLTKPASFSSPLQSTLQVKWLCGMCV